MLIILAGLAWLGTAIGALIGVAVELFGIWITKKTLVSAAYVAAYAAIVAILFSACNGLISAITVNLPSQFNEAAGMFLPQNSYVCLSAIITAYGARYVYEQSIKILDYVAAS